MRAALPFAQVRVWSRTPGRAGELDGLSERKAVQNYVKAGHLLALLHSKARKSLKAKKAS